MGDFLTDVTDLRKRAREHIEQGPITSAYGADRDRSLRSSIRRWRQSWSASCATNATTSLPAASRLVRSRRSSCSMPPKRWDTLTRSPCA